MRKLQFSILLLALLASAFTSIAQQNPDKAYEPVILQGSIFYPVGTNGKNINVVNYTSFNLIYGRAAALEGFELSGIAGSLTDYGVGVQIAGFGNGVGNYFKGLQIAGFGNAIGTSLEGTQISGFGSVAGSSVRGMQIAGFGSVAGAELEGLQISGFGSIAGSSAKGTQISGFGNIAGGNMEGFQMAGFGNISGGDMKGFQLAGFGNICGGSGDGAQIAGFMNVNSYFSGFQLAPLNLNDSARGFQIGVVNIAKSYNGIPFGVISWVKDGYRKIEISGNESFYLNAAFKTGVHEFYNILSVSYRPGTGYSRYGLGWGLGSEIDLGKNAFMNIEAIATQVGENEIWTNKLNLLNQLKLNFGATIAPRLAIFGGPTFNVMVSEYQNPDGSIGSGIVPSWNFHNKTSGKTNVAIWAGFNAGLRIL